MKKRRINPNLAKIHRSYKVEEIADLFLVHKNTVRLWIKDGLQTIDDQRPTLVLGVHLVDYLKARRQSRKRPCKANEMFCVRCKEPKRPVEGLIEYVSITESLGNLIAICPACCGIMNRRTSLTKIRTISQEMEISFPQALKHIVESIKPSLDSDLKRGL